MKQGQLKSEKLHVDSPLINLSPPNPLVGGKYSYRGIKSEGNTGFVHCSPFILIHHTCVSSKITVPAITKDNITAYLGSHFTVLFYGHTSVQCFS